MNEEQIIKLASLYVNENNKIYKHIFAAKKNFYFTVNTDEGVYKVKQVDKNDAEKYSLTDIQDIFKLKKYSNPIAEESIPSIDAESEFKNIDDLSEYTPEDISTDLTDTEDTNTDIESEDNAKNQNCVNLVKNKPASFEYESEMSLQEIAKEFPNCSLQEQKQIFKHLNEYQKSLAYLKVLMFLERQKHKQYQKQESENNFDTESFDDVQKEAFRLHKQLENKSITQGNFVEEMSSFIDLHKERINSRVKGFDNLVMNALEVAALRKPIITSTPEQMKKNIEHIKKRGLLDYLLRDPNKSKKEKDYDY